MARCRATVHEKGELIGNGREYIYRVHLILRMCSTIRANVLRYDVCQDTITYIDEGKLETGPFLEGHTLLGIVRTQQPCYYSDCLV